MSRMLVSRADSTSGAVTDFDGAATGMQAGCTVFGATASVGEYRPQPDRRSTRRNWYAPPVRSG